MVWSCDEGGGGGNKAGEKEKSRVWLGKSSSLL